MIDPVSTRKKMMKKVEEKIAVQEAEQKAHSEAEAAKLAEIKQWLELATASMLEDRKKIIGERRPPTPERLRAMAKRFHMATTSHEEHEIMYMDLLLHIINRLDESSRNQFNTFLAQLQGKAND